VTTGLVFVEQGGRFGKDWTDEVCRKLPRNIVHVSGILAKTLNDG